MTAIAPHDTDALEQSGTTQLVAQGDNAGVLAMVAQTEGEIKGMMILARQFPRDTDLAFARALQHCKRPGFAQEAMYVFPRGGTKIEGPSVKMSRALATSWGNLRAGFRIASIDEEYIHLVGFCLDLETNTWQEYPSKFKRLVQRKRDGKTIWVRPDERDQRELTGRHGAICERNAVLKVLPPDLVSECVTATKRTLELAARGEIEEDREKAIRSIVVGFHSLLVTRDHLEDYLGHPIEAISPEELADLRGVYRSIAEGNTRADEHFEFGDVDQDESTTELNEQLRKRQAEADKEASDERGDGSAEKAPKAELIDLIAQLEAKSGLELDDGMSLRTEHAGHAELAKCKVDGLRAYYRHLQERAQE